MPSNFGYVVHSFSLNSRKPLTSLFLPIPSGDLVESCSVSMSLDSAVSVVKVQLQSMENPLIRFMRLFQYFFLIC